MKLFVCGPPDRESDLHMRKDQLKAATAPMAVMSRPRPCENPKSCYSGQIDSPAEGRLYGSRRRGTCRCVVNAPDAALLRVLQRQKTPVANTKPATNDPTAAPAMAPGCNDSPLALLPEELGSTGEPEDCTIEVDIDAGCDVATSTMLM